MRILVTGGTGFIGRFLIPQLLDRPEAAVTLLLRKPANSYPSRCNVVYADLRQRKQTIRAVAEAAPDAVIHLAAAGATDPFLAVETAVRHNLHGTLNLLHACFEKDRGVKQFIVARTPGERHAANPYAASKAAAWEFCRMYARTQAQPIHGAMIFQAYGPGQPAHAFIPAAFRAALSGADFPMTAGTQMRDWIYIEDVAAGFLAILGRRLPPGTTLDIGTGTAASLADVADLIYQTANRGGRPLPGALPNRPGEEPTQTADTARTETLIGWQANLSLADGIARLYQTVEL